MEGEVSEVYILHRSRKGEGNSTQSDNVMQMLGVTVCCGQGVLRR